MESLSQNLDLQVLCAQYDVRESSISKIVEKLLPVSFQSSFRIGIGHESVKNCRLRY